mgnify:CR=1 FL=1
MFNKTICGGILSCGVDVITEVRYKENGRYRVVNYTHRYFAIGFSTSGFGALGAVISTNNAKRGSRDGDTHTRFTGLLAQIFFLAGKAYLYVFLKGDGLGRG